jgi:hypothetical protein
VSGCTDSQFLTSALVEGEWSASRSGHFTAEEKAPGTHWIGGWMGPRTGLDDEYRRQILPLLEIRPSAVLLVAGRYPGRYPAQDKYSLHSSIVFP